MFIKLSLRNIQRSMKDYTIYFFTLVLGIAMFYMFNSIESQTVMMNISASTKEIIQLMLSILSGVSVFVSCILAFLIIYANRFLMKRRKKEFAIYMTLGMGKRQISSIILCETLFIGFISLVVGILVGIILSQVMSVFVAGMFEVDMTRFEFIFSQSAMIKTILYFAIIYLIVMVFNIFFIGKQELIDLFISHNKNETIKARNLWVCIFVFIVATFMLGYAYYLVTAGISFLNTADKIFLPISLGIIATFMIFYSVSGFVLKIFMMKKTFYFKNLNAFVMRQLSSQMNTTIFSMSVICLMLFMTICILSSGISIKNAMSAEMKEMTPVDLCLYKNWNLSKEEYTEEEIKYSHFNIKETLETFDFSVDKNLKDVFMYNNYATNDLTIKDTLGSMYQQIKAQYPQLRFDDAEQIVRLSDYNRVAKLYGLSTYTLEDQQYMIIANFKNMASIRNLALEANEPIQLLGKTYYPKYNVCREGYMIIAANYTNSGIIIVPDQAVDESIKNQNILIANYNANDKQSKRKIEEQINQFDYIEGVSKLSLYESSIGLGAMVTFIAIYLGIIFLVSGATILALKQLSESVDNKERYHMLRKIGVDEVMLNKALLTQIVLFFMAPLILALIHSFFGIKFCEYILSTFGDEKLMTSIFLTALFIILIYGGYMIITYLNSKVMIKE
ncbi:MAG: ABC transporter permease [Coprobacillus sp.]|nr:ABC transporter permease [Coprobacillus sp.]